MLDGGTVRVSVSNLVRQAMPGLPADADLAPGADLRAAGLTSVGAVNLMLAVEAAFGIALPDAELTPANFKSIEAIEALVRRHVAAAA